MWAHASWSKRVVLCAALALVVLTVVFVSGAVAEPRIWASGATLERDSTLVGEQVAVEVQMHNNGDPGAYTVDVASNGSTIASERIQMDADSDRTARIPITVDKPGTYTITADGNTAGVLKVTRIRATFNTAAVWKVTRIRVGAVNDHDDGRTTLLLAGATNAGSELTADLPATGDMPFGLRQVTMTGPGSAFNRSIVTDASLDNATFSVPSDDSSALLGAIDMDPVSGVNTTALRLELDREAIRNVSLGTDDVVVYRKTDANYLPLRTTRVSTTENVVVYEATAESANQFVVGSLSPSFTVRSQKLSTGNSTDGMQITLTAAVANDGHVAGNYTAEMRVNGSPVDEQTVAIPAGETAPVTLTHEITSQGDYEVSLGDQFVGSVVLTGTGLPSMATDTPSGAGSNDAVSDGSFLDGVLSRHSLEDVGLVDVGIGAGIVVVGGTLLILLRR